jgi:CubicO group peptidase (beta-lactamase class C family)
MSAHGETATILMRLLILLLALALAGQCSSESDDTISAIFENYRGDDTPGAAVLVVEDGESVYTGTFGMANLESGEPVRPNTNFRLASITKQFTAMCILMLVDRGQLGLDESIVEIFPDAPEFMRPITVTNLLQHTSGLLDYEDFVPADSPTQVTDRDVLQIVFATDSTYFEPGSDYRYSNSGYAVLAMVVEEQSGLSFAQFLKTNIFEPLGMDGSVAFQKGISTVANRAIGYSVTDVGIENTDQSPWSAVLGDGGIYSSLEDLYKWDQALYGESLVSRDLLQLAFTPHLETYGFGWRIDSYKGHKRYHHSGSTSGFRNYLQRFPNEHLTVIVLTNRADPSVDLLGEQVADLYLDG